MFGMCSCADNNLVKFASGTLEGVALTWWNSQVQVLGLEAANNMPWQEFKNLLKAEYSPRDQIKNLEAEFWNLNMEGSEIEAYTSRNHELSVLCPNMVTAEFQRIEGNLEGLVPQIHSMVTSSATDNLYDVIKLAHMLTDQVVRQGTLPPKKSAKGTADGKQKWDEANNNVYQGNNNNSVSAGNSGNSVTPPPEAESRERNETEYQEHMFTNELEWHSIQALFFTKPA
jgi:hypothetical protein